MPPIADLKTSLAQLTPTLNPGRYCFVTLPENHQIDPAQIVGSIREPEGLSVILPQQEALEHALHSLFTAAWITLGMPSDLAAVGLTAAFSQALGDARIACNVVAGACHDHLFVPFDEAPRAMQVLRDLQRRSAAV